MKLKIVTILIMFNLILITGCLNSKCTEGWKKQEYVGIPNNIDDAKEYFISKNPEVSDITLIEKIITVDGRNLSVYSPESGGTHLLGSDGYWYVFVLC